MAQDLARRRVAVDLPNLAYGFYAPQMLRVRHREGALKAMRRGIAQRVLDLASLGARCIAVLDGPPHPLKAAALEAREAARQNSGVSRLDAADYAVVEDLLIQLGVPIVRAPHDAEAQASRLCLDGAADLVATTDWDALALGAPLLLRGLHGPQGAWELVDAAEAFRVLDVRGPSELALAAVLMGCDVSDGLAGVGPKRGLRLAREAAGELSRVGIDLSPLPDAAASLQAFLNPPATSRHAIAWAQPSKACIEPLRELGINEPTLQLARLSSAHHGGHTLAPAPAVPKGPLAQSRLGGFLS